MVGRREEQKLERQARAGAFVDRLLPRLNIEDIERSGRLIPRGTLKRRCVKRIFGFVTLGVYGGRIFTSRLCKLIIRELLRRLQFTPPRDPKESFTDYVSKEALRLQLMARKAKRMSSKDPLMTRSNNFVGPNIYIYIYTVCVHLTFFSWSPRCWFRSNLH